MIGILLNDGLRFNNQITSTLKSYQHSRVYSGRTPASPQKLGFHEISLALLFTTKGSWLRILRIISLRGKKICLSGSCGTHIGCDSHLAQSVLFYKWEKLSVQVVSGKCCTWTQRITNVYPSVPQKNVFKTVLLVMNNTNDFSYKMVCSLFKLNIFNVTDLI